MVSIKQIEAFYWTARLGTIQKAALKLSVTQSAITKRVQEVERRSSGPLFHRRGTKLLLTDHGYAMLRRVQTLLTSLASLDSMKSSSSQLKRTLRVGVTELTALTWFGAFVKALREAYPALTLHPEVDLSATLKDKLLEGALDIAFVQDFYLDSSTASIKVQSVQYGWFCSPGAFPTDRDIPLTELACLPLIEQTVGSGLTRLTRAQFDSLGIETKFVFGTNSVAALGGLVAAGMGVACLPVRYFQPQIRLGKISPIRTIPAAPVAQYHAVFYPDDHATLGASIAQIAKKCSAHW
jgi:DNA-binding transcriptional LysR family regulator